MEKVEILKTIVNNDGIIIRWPKKKEEKRAVLEYLITKFERGKKYSELEVNMIIKKVAFLQRPLSAASRTLR